MLSDSWKTQALLFWLATRLTGNHEWDLERVAEANAHEILLSQSDLQLLQEEGVIYTQTLAGKGMTLKLDRQTL